MKKINTFLAITAFVVSGNIVNSQTVAKPNEVGTWEDFRVSAVSYTFDDNLTFQYTRAIPALDELGYKATFNTVTSSASPWTPDWTTLNTMAGNGHEIASHTIDHGDLSTLKDSLQNIQLGVSQETINKNVTNQKCVTIAYPYCVPGNNKITSKYYIAARHCQGNIEGKTPANFMSISSVICGSKGSVNSMASFKARINEAVNKKGWCVFLIHDLDNGSGYSPLSSSIFRSSLYYCKIRNYKVWVSTFANVSKYIKERNSASVSEVSANDSVITLQVTDTLDNTLYDYPISIRRPLPANWKAVEITQNDKAINAKYVKTDTVTYIMFSVIPDNGEVKLKSANYDIDFIDQTIEDADTVSLRLSIPSEMEGNSTNSIKLYCASGNLRFELPTDSGKDIDISIYNTLGVLLATYRLTNISNNIGSIQLSENILKSKNCIVKVSDGRALWSQVVLL
jgi:hypothetical protein